MKKIFFILFLFSLVVNSFGQKNISKTEKSIQAKVHIIPFQTEQDTLINGVCKIELKDTTMDNYVVMLTPYGAAESLFIAEKNTTYFVVKDNSKSNGKFDYFVFIIPKKASQSKE